jgi:hypothetical protein
LTIRENMLGVVVVAGGVLLVTKMITFSQIPGVVIALANGYGLIVLCLAMGYGLVAVPRYFWQNAKASRRYLYHLFRIASEVKKCAQAVADGDAITSLCTAASAHRFWDRVGRIREARLAELKGSIAVPESVYVRSHSKEIHKFDDVRWSEASDLQLEEFVSVLDKTVTAMEETNNILTSSTESALSALKHLERGYSGAWWRRVLAVVTAIINLVCLWGEVTLMFNRKLSLSHVVSHLKLPPAVGLCWSTPMLAWLLFLGVWALTHLRLGSFFRFTVGATNGDTLNYFGIILARLAPTIGFHYLQQLQASNSAFQKTMGTMDVVVFIGSSWNIYSPICLILVLLFFAFSLPDRILSCFGREPFSFEWAELSNEHLALGQEVLENLQSEAKDLIDDGWTFSRIISDASGWRNFETVGRKRPAKPEDFDVEIPLTLGV